jgi:DNA-binding transcriptional MerR regulator
MLGVGLATLTCVAWKWRPLLRGTGRCVRAPGGGRCNIYPIETIERIQAAQAAAAQPQIPQGFVDKAGACRMLGVSRAVLKNWVRQGKIRFGHRDSSAGKGSPKLYAVEDLRRLQEELFGDDKLYKRSDGSYHVPAEFIGREEAWTKFGVSMPTWWRWEREGKITCGQRVPGGPKLYKLEDINRLLDEYGRYAPPYPDPDRPGVYRVPLSGRDIRRREALIDADALPLIDGGSCSWSETGDFGFVAFSRGDVRGVPLRRIIMGMTDTDLNVRHVSGDPLDCRRENLVVRTVQQRARNARKRKAIKGRAPTSRFKGVYWEEWTKKWRAAIGVDGKSRRLGRFGDEIAAAVAYDEAARLWFGEHAWLNFPDGVDAWLEREGFTPGGRAAA